ncbi:hypothetical protein [Bradyrhizobium sp. NAS96.2]|uniref:hypothetical protein n=1 Tax=Bradyrhizobium sp. NAS96.2 TaxID=1680160 RepID=UPI0009680DBF|nr:hypothetical protein [Bradyrhizobium sp. NAS96.2]OKO73039.1 hypothetical protein AC628_25285 [Bradyrhizobium sp. NAS96.2]
MDNAEAAQAARRANAILACPEARLHKALALQIATTTSLSYDEARALMRAAKATPTSSTHVGSNEPLRASADISRPTPAAAGPSASDIAKAERGRFAAITALPEAKGREGLAMNLATTTDMTVDQVKATLSAAPLAAAGDHAVGPSIAPANPNAAIPQNVSAQWDAVLKSRGMVLQGDSVVLSATPAMSGLPTLPRVAIANPAAQAMDWGAVLQSRGMQVDGAK